MSDIYKNWYKSVLMRFQMISLSSTRGRRVSRIKREVSKLDEKDKIILDKLPGLFVKMGKHAVIDGDALLIDDHFTLDDLYYLSMTLTSVFLMRRIMVKPK